jgi:hypothetical protein
MHDIGVKDIKVTSGPELARDPFEVGSDLGALRTFDNLSEQ